MSTHLQLIIMFTIVSYNSDGLAADRFDFIGSLCNDFDFIMIQETWLLTENLCIFHDRFRFMSCHGVSAMDSRQISVGRPHGGGSILWRSNLTCKITPLDSDNTRVCAILIELSNMKILLVNVYMPTDTRFDSSNVSLFNDV